MEGNFPDVILVFKITSSLVALLVFLLLRFVVRRAIDSYSATHKMAPGRAPSVKRAVSVIGMLVLAGIWSVVWSINFQSIMVASGAILATVGIAFFAQWSILSNVTTSIIMFWRFPMRVGDRIGLLDDKSFVAEVKDFTPFYVILEDKDGNIITLPNALSLQQMFILYRDGNSPEYEPAAEEADSDRAGTTGAA